MVKLASINLSDFVKLGLSEQEARVYLTLLEQGPLSVKELAKSISVLPNALYRLFNELVIKKLVTNTQTHPAIYKAISPSIAFDAFVKKQITEMELIKNDVIRCLKVQNTQDQTRIDLIESAREFFLAYSRLAIKAKNEILIISIGEEVPEEVLLANRDCLQKGVVIRFIAHKFDQSNKDILERWLKMGLEVRHYSDWGFHLVVFDRKMSLLSANDPKNTNNRLGMQIFSAGLSKALSDYFYFIWEKSSPIKLQN